MSEQERIQRVIQIAEKEIGYLEKRSGKELDSKTANAGSANYTKYWRDTAPEYQGQPWCAGFISWCFEQAFGTAEAGRLLKHWPYVYCPTLGSLFQKYNTPKAGDIVLFSHNGTFTHTGLVTAVNGEKFQTIEGNTSGASGIVPNGGGVCSKSYDLNHVPGSRFCRPEYSKEVSIETGGSKEGKKEDPKESRVLNTVPKWTGCVTATVLNVRRWAGAEYPKLTSIPSLKKGEVVEVCDTVMSATGVPWYYVRIQQRIFGFVCGKYITENK